MKGVAKDAFKIVLTHDPHHWRREVQKTGVHLTLAGHTHAGQLKIGNFIPAHIVFQGVGWRILAGVGSCSMFLPIGRFIPFPTGCLAGNDGHHPET